MKGERELQSGMSEEQVTEHFVATLHNLNTAFNSETEKSRDVLLGKVIDFLPLFREKVRELQGLLLHVKKLKQDKEWKSVHRNAYTFFEKMAQESAKQLLADVFLAQYVQHCKKRRRKDRKPADVFLQVLSDLNITTTSLRSISLNEILKTILLTDALKHSLPQDFEPVKQKTSVKPRL